jgi:hypothetical protein
MEHTAEITPDAKSLFLDGETASVRLGGYGGTVHVEVVQGKVRIRATVPKRKQREFGSDSTDVRRLAVTVAEKILAGPTSTAAAPAKPTRVIRDGVHLLTVREIWEAYLQSLLGVLPSGILDWGRGELETYFVGLTPTARQVIPSYDSIHTILLAARRFDRDGALKLDADFSSLRSGHLTAYLKAQVMAGSSPHTMKTYWGRFRTAVRSYKNDWPIEWGERHDPTDKVRCPTTSGVTPPEVGEDRAKALIRELRRLGFWQAAAACIIALASGRRIGAIGARRQGTQLDHPPLTGSDFRRGEDGLEVVWRAAASKGDGYGQGDCIQVCPRDMEACVRWLRRFHPNPLGVDHPLIWDERDPSKGAKYDMLRNAVVAAWRALFGTEKPPQLAFHAYCRTTITTIADELGIGAAAEHTGRSAETAQRTYKRKRQQNQVRTARVLDEIRRSARVQRT